MVIGIVVGSLTALLLSAIFFIVVKRQQSYSEATFEHSAQKALGVMVQEIVKTTREQLQAEKQDISSTIAKDLKQQSDVFKDLTTSLKQEIDTRQKEIRSLEEDRNRKYGEISQALTDYKTLTLELRSSTEQLKKILANNQLRGNWGEIQAQKILEAAGMISGTHFAKQQPIDDQPHLRPDFTVFLPNKMQLYIDVKFPLQSLQLAMQTDDKVEQQRSIAQFGRDVKERMKETHKYILSNGSCVDYVILFVPSESVFEIINRQLPGIIDEGFSQKVILASPHSFFAVVRTIFESYVNFHYEQNLKEILQYLQTLLANFDRFKVEFADVGKALTVAQTKYKYIEETRYAQIKRASEKITQHTIATNEVQIPLDSPLPLVEENSISHE
jgi:DNA recombination protein RmuC